MPIFPGLPEVEITMHVSREQWDGIIENDGFSPAVNRLERGEHTGTRLLSNKEVHHICGELGYTHYENLINLHRLIGRGRFRFIGLPLRIRGGTGSPVRAVAVFEP